MVLRAKIKTKCKNENKYQNRTIETAKIIEELIKLGKKLRDEHKRGEGLNLNEDEIAFYDALSNKKEVRDVMSEKVLKDIAKELVTTIRENKSVDWNIRENARATMRLTIKKLLRKYKYPPKQQQNVLTLVMEQAERTCNYIDN